MGYDEEVREQALQLYLEGNSLRSIGRNLRVHHASVSNWISVHANTLPRQVANTEPARTVEVDELFAYVGNKQTCLRIHQYTAIYCDDAFSDASTLLCHDRFGVGLFNSKSAVQANTSCGRPYGWSQKQPGLTVLWHENDE